MQCLTCLLCCLVSLVTRFWLAVAGECLLISVYLLFWRLIGYLSEVVLVLIMIVVLMALENDKLFESDRQVSFQILLVNLFYSMVIDSRLSFLFQEGLFLQYHCYLLLANHLVHILESCWICNLVHSTSFVPCESSLMKQQFKVCWVYLNYSSDRSSSGGHLVGLLLLGLAPDFRISFLLGFIFFQDQVFIIFLL